MSLIEEAAELFAFMDKAHTPDGLGGFTVTWTEGAEFKASLRLDSSIQAKRAEAEGVRDIYTVFTSRDVKLVSQDVILRKETGETFRVTANSDDNKTPRSAGLNLRAVSAEKWELIGNEK